MTEAQKREAALAELEALGIPRELAAPPGYRLIWWLGLSPRPPLFQSFGGAFLVHFGLMLAVGLVLILGLLPRLLLEEPPFPYLAILGIFLGGFVALGLLVGLPGAAYYRAMKRDLRLPPWPLYAAGKEQIRYQPIAFEGVSRASRWKAVRGLFLVMVICYLVALFTWCVAVATGESVSQLQAADELYLVTTKVDSMRYLRTSPALHTVLVWANRLGLLSLAILVPVVFWAGPKDYRRAAEGPS